jgi:hypothetical protein
MEIGLVLTNIIIFALSYVLPAYFCARFARSIFVSKKWNPTAGLIIGGLVGLIASYVGLIILWLVQNRVVSRTKTFALYRGGPQRLEVTWGYGFKNVLIKFDGVNVGTISSPKEAKQWKSFRLPDGGDLQIKIGTNPVNFYILPEMTLNGKPLPESANDPALEIKAASNAFVYGGLFNFAGGIIYSSVNPGWYTVLLFVLGVLALISGIYIGRKSRAALNLGYVVAVISGLTFVMSVVGSTSVDMDFFGDVFDLVDTVAFIYGLSKGKTAIDQLEKEIKTQPS